jgi:NitT/TauT family transport system substrate-binding protein
MKKSSLRWVGLILAVSLVVQACGSDDTTDTSADTGGTTTTTTVVATSTTTAPSPTTTSTIPEPATVKVVTLPFITFAPFPIGVERGYFAEQGIEVEVVKMARQEEILPALSSGQVDVSSGLVSAGMFNAIARGSKIRLVADKGNVDPDSCINWAVIGRNDLVESGELDAVGQLAGRKVNIVPATWLEFYLSEVLAAGGLTLDDITRENIGSAAQPDALDQDQLDATVQSEPFVTRLGSAGHLPVFDLPQVLLPNATAAAVVFGPTLLEDNPELGARFMAAYLKSVEAYLEGKTPENLATIAEFTSLPLELLEAMCWPSLRPDGVIDTESVTAFEQFAFERGYIDEIVDPADFYDQSFIEAANALMGNG